MINNKVIFVSILAILILLNVSCENGKDIEDPDWTYLAYDSLPDTVKYHFFQNSKPQANNTFPMWNEAFTINLDSPRSTMSWEKKGLHGLYPGKTYFYVNEDTYYYSSTSSKIASPPFILFRDQLYFCSRRNIISEEEILEARYVRINLHTP
jgi:hypothetical protein